MILHDIAEKALRVTVRNKLPWTKIRDTSFGLSLGPDKPTLQVAFYHPVHVLYVLTPHGEIRGQWHGDEVKDLYEAVSRYVSEAEADRTLARNGSFLRYTIGLLEALDHEDP